MGGEGWVGGGCWCLLWVTGAQTPKFPKSTPTVSWQGACRDPRVYSTVRCLGSRPPSDTNTSLVAQTVKDLPARQETQVGSLGWEDPLEEVLAPHYSIVA